MAIPGAGPQPQPTRKALAAQKKAASLSINKKGQDPAATVVEIPKHKDESSNGRPDKSAYDNEQDELRKQIDTLQTKLNDIKNKISTSSIKGGPHHERKIELRKQLDEVRNDQQKIRGGRGKTVEQLGAMQEQLKKKISELQTAKAKLPYKTVEDVDNQIKNLDRQVESGTMKLVEEKKALSEISSLRKSRKTVESFGTLQSAIDSDKKKIDEVRALLDDPEQKKLDEQFKSIKRELDEVNKKMEEQSKGRDALFDERNTLSQQLDELFTKKKASAQNFREANNKYYEKLNSDRAKRDEKRREERRAHEASKRDEINQQLLEEAQAPAFEREIEDCRNLILFFQQRIGQAPTDASSSSSASSSLFSRPQVNGVPKLELRKVEQDLPQGAVLRKKGEQDQDEGLGGWGGVKNKKKGNNKKAAASGEESSAATSDQLLNLPFGTLAALMSLGITAPLTSKDVPQTIDNLELKKRYFTDNQDRVTKERVAAVEKKIAAALESSNGKSSNGTATPVAPEVAEVAHAEPTQAEDEVKEGAEKIAEPTEPAAEVADDETKKDDE